MTAARSACTRITFSHGNVSAKDATSLARACTAALSSPEVAAHLVQTVHTICDRNTFNKLTCGATGVIGALFAAMSAHGTALSPDTVAMWFEALVRLAAGSSMNVDVIVLSPSVCGLDVIERVMTAHVASEPVQRAACSALHIIAYYASPAALTVMREGRAVELIITAMRTHPEEEEETVKYYGRKALGRLRPPEKGR